MKPHTRIYFDFFGYDQSDFIECEVTNCGCQATEIHHIDCRGMGGNPNKDKDNIFNLMAMCRKHHIELGDKKQHKDSLREMHLFRMAELQPRKTEEMLNEIYENLDLNEIDNQL